MKNRNDFWICGKHTVIEAAKHRSYDFVEILVNSKEKAKELKDISNQFKIRICENNQLSNKLNNIDLAHQGYLAKILTPKFEKKITTLSQKQGDFIILDGVTDPRNIGSIIRTSVAFGINNLLVKDREFNEKSTAMYKSASGAMEKINIYKYPNIKYGIAKLKEDGFKILALDLKSKKFINADNFSKKNAFIFGSEGKGISANILKLADELIKIKIKNVESLNVSNSVSATLSIYNYTNKSLK